MGLLKKQNKNIFIILAIFMIAIIIDVECQEIIKTRNKDKVRFAFGSCNKFTEDQPSEIFSKVALQKADVFAWLGDAAYIDVRQFIHYWTPEKNTEAIIRKFNNVLQDKHYKELLATNTKIIGVWDDHDYNHNDGGKDFKGKHEIQQLYLDFLNEAKESHRRTSDSGIYTSYYLGEDKRVKVILLDVRFQRDHRRDINPTDMLGDKQWTWLENELSDKEVFLNLIGTGTQFIPDDRFFQEQWYNESRRKLLTIIREKKAPVLFLSGDIHQAEIMQMPCSEQYIGYVLREITSSGLSFTNAEMTTLVPFFTDIVKVVVPPTFSSHEFDRYLHRNYGMVNIEWNNTDIYNSIVQLHIYGNKTLNPVIAQEYYLHEFQFNSKNIQDQIECPTYQKTPGQRQASNLIQLLKEYDLAAILIVFISSVLCMHIMKIAKIMLFSCCRGAMHASQNIKIKQD